MFQASRWKVLEVLILYWLGIFPFFFLFMRVCAGGSQLDGVGRE